MKILADLEPLATPVDELHSLPGNPRRGDVDAVARSLQRFGQRKPIVARRSDRTVIAGNHTLAAAKQLGAEKIAVVWTDDDSVASKAYALADNRTAELGGYDDADLAEMIGTVHDIDHDLLDATGWTDDDLEKLLADLDPWRNAPKTGGNPDDVPTPPENPVTKPGDVWKLGRHTLYAGDCTSADVVDALGLADVDLVCTDPPYCSGGFQESGKSQGSVGTEAAHKQIANDRLSTRGYIALLKSALNRAPARYIYAFTDWRMWVYLFDVVESLNFGVRSMIVWDKGTPGMGRGWRSQHELVMWGSKQTPPFDKHMARHGNVIQAQRTGNDLHTTQKPVDLIAELLGVTEFARVVYDPFAGSGTTLVACEQVGRTAKLCELDLAYCDVICHRYQALTGVKPTRGGVPHDFLS